jgi:hypothetical protein
VVVLWVNRLAEVTGPSVHYFWVYPGSYVIEGVPGYWGLPIHPLTEAGTAFAYGGALDFIPVCAGDVVYG